MGTARPMPSASRAFAVATPITSSAASIMLRTWVPTPSGLAVSTPQNRAMRRLADSEVVRPMIGVRGRNRET